MRRMSIRRELDPTSDRALYKQLADILREEIQAGRLAPGDHLPSEGRLAQEYELGRDTVRDALWLLRSEGLIDTVSGLGSRVRTPRETTAVMPDPGTDVVARAPTEAERRRLGISEGVPVLVAVVDGRERLLPADRTVIRIPG